MSAHPFLSPEWIDAVSAIRDEYRDRVSAPDFPIKANVTITDAPFDDSTVVGHIDTSAGALSLEVGHLDDDDFAIEMPYDVAHQIFVDRDPQAMMGILVGGQVKLTGDSSKILGLAGMAAPPDPDSEVGSLAREVIGRIDAVTERPST
ncbi:MAG: hypothetical protein AAF548_10575 [Actinomycetota bacterium]